MEGKFRIFNYWGLVFKKYRLDDKIIMVGILRYSGETELLNINFKFQLTSLRSKSEEEIMNNSVQSIRSKTRKLTYIGLLSGITMFLGLTGYGFIKLPVANITIMHIPVIIGTIIEGPIVGLAIGFMFGFFSLIQNMMAPNLLSFAFLNPLVSVLPRMLIPLTTYGVYKVLKIKNESIRIGVATAVGSITNTVGVLSMIMILYIDKYAANKNLSIDGAKKLIYGLIYTNGILEAIAAVIITVAIVTAVKKVKR